MGHRQAESLWQEGARVHSVPFDVEFLADNLFLAFTLARDVLVSEFISPFYMRNCDEETPRSLSPPTRTRSPRCAQPLVGCPI